MRERRGEKESENEKTTALSASKKQEAKALKGTSRLAGYGERGKIFVNKHVPTQFKGIHMKERLLRHEKVERRLRKEEGLTYHEAHKQALKAEHKGMGKKQIATYEGKLGSIARHQPYKHSR